MPKKCSCSPFEILISGVEILTLQDAGMIETSLRPNCLLGQLLWRMAISREQPTRMSVSHIGGKMAISTTGLAPVQMVEGRLGAR